MNGWELIEWDGNPDLKYKCWRKKFYAGHVSVGVGEFQTVCYSYGATSDSSLSSTRWHYGRVISEEDMMAWVDKCAGKHQAYPLTPGQYAAWWNTLDQTRRDAILGVGQPWHNQQVALHEQRMAI